MRLLLPVVLLVPVLSVAAQAPWEGEWGAYTGPHAEQGRRLEIKGCQQQRTPATCTFDIQAEQPDGHAGTASAETLTLQTPTTASARLPGGSASQVCQLRFVLQPAPEPEIVVRAEGESCTSYYSTSAAVSLTGTYALRSRTIYSGSDLKQCFLDGSPARLTICTHPDLAKLEETWSDLAETFPLQRSPGQNAYGHAQQMDAAILQGCDRAADPTACLTTRFQTEVTAMQERQQTYLQGTVDRGDPAEGGRLARKIAGSYRHREANGDVQGDHYTTTDTLTIQPVGTASIHFRTYLNFFNGHTCSLSGGALFRKDGSFVLDDAASHAVADEPVCRLAITPTATGVEFKDITGGCKMVYCGERGGWDGEGFLFKERTSAPDAR